MASYRTVTNNIVPTAPMANTDTIYSQALDISSFESCSFQPSWTGTPTGTFSILVSNDGSTWDDLGASIATNPAGSPGHCFVPVFACCSKYIKLKYVNASGSGVLSGKFFGKTR